MTLRLLVTTRDVGATLSLIEIVKAARLDATFSTSVVAQRPAFDYLRAAGLDATLVNLPPARTRDDDDAAALLGCARGTLEDTHPDAVLAGLSTPLDGGIDEAVIALAGVSTFVMQDFWGEANAFFGKAADFYLGLDEEAVRLTRKRHGVEGIAIGSPRHAAYAELNPSELRGHTRGALAITEPAIVYGLFGQGLHHLEGYRRTVRDWALAVRALPGPTVAIYRAHPRESPADAEATLQLIRSTGLECRLTQTRTVEESLVACDVVCSAFSLCNYDSVYLNRYATEPLITPVSLMFDPEVRAYCRDNVHLDEFPYLHDGLALAAWRAEDLGVVLGTAGLVATRREAWAAARRMPDPRGAAARALDAIRSRVDRLRSRGRPAVG
ncbi:MAG: hypothetical protein AB7O37_20905 [Vicinamibacteria bacterium]